jgi:hypothetical protein
MTKWKNKNFQLKEQNQNLLELLMISNDQSHNVQMMQQNLEYWWLFIINNVQNSNFQLNSNGLKPEKDDEKSSEEEWLPDFERDLWGFTTKVVFLLKRGLLASGLISWDFEWIYRSGEAEVNPALD